MSTYPNVVSNTVPKAIVVLPQETPYIQHSVQYFQDGLTETVYLFLLLIFTLITRARDVRSSDFLFYFCEHEAVES